MKTWTKTEAMPFCLKCNGSSRGPVQFDPECEHDMSDSAPEPHASTVLSWCIPSAAIPGGALASSKETLWFAVGRYTDGTIIDRAHPTREGAISLWKAEYCRRRIGERARAGRTREALAKLSPSWAAVLPASTTTAEIGKAIREHVEDGRRRFGPGTMTVGAALSDSKPNPDGTHSTRVAIGPARWTPERIASAKAKIDAASFAHEMAASLGAEETADEGCPTRVEIAESKADVGALMHIAGFGRDKAERDSAKEALARIGHPVPIGVLYDNVPPKPRFSVGDRVVWSLGAGFKYHGRLVDHRGTSPRFPYAVRIDGSVARVPQLALESELEPEPVPTPTEAERGAAPSWELTDSATVCAWSNESPPTAEIGKAVAVAAQAYYGDSVRIGKTKSTYSAVSISTEAQGKWSTVDYAPPPACACGCGTWRETDIYRADYGGTRARFRCSHCDMMADVAGVPRG